METQNLQVKCSTKIEPIYFIEPKDSSYKMINAPDVDMDTKLMYDFINGNVEYLDEDGEVIA